MWKTKREEREVVVPPLLAGEGGGWETPAAFPSCSGHFTAIDSRPPRQDLPSPDEHPVAAALVLSLSLSPLQWARFFSWSLEYQSKFVFVHSLCSAMSSRVILSVLAYLRVKMCLILFFFFWRCVWRRWKDSPSTLTPAPNGNRNSWRADCRHPAANLQAGCRQPAANLQKRRSNTRANCVTIGLALPARWGATWSTFITWR